MIKVITFYKWLLEITWNHMIIWKRIQYLVAQEGLTWLKNNQSNLQCFRFIQKIS